MVRIGSLLLCLLLLLPVFGVEAAGQYVAFVFETGDSPAAALELSRLLEGRKAKITLLLGENEKVDPEKGQELALICPTEWNALTRLQVARQLGQLQEQLPQDTAARWLSPRGSYSDSVRQVAGAMGYSLLGPSKTGMNAPAALKLTNQVRSGDVIYMGKVNAPSVTALANMMNILEKRGFQFVTVSELASRQRIHPTPGEFYNTFRRKFPE